MKYITICGLLLILKTQATFAEEKIEFWDKQKVGTNFFNQVETTDRLKAAEEAGFEVIRLTFTKWKSHMKGAPEGVFLIGNLDKYSVLVEEDLKQLTQILDEANKLHLKVILTTLSLPGSRWRQHNKNKNDLRLWQDEHFQKQAAMFWRDLALRLKDHPAVVGYNLINEPVPEQAHPKLKDWYRDDYEGWCKKVAGTSADLSLFYKKLTKAIREVDSHTPIIVDSGFYSTPWGFKCLKPLGDEKVVYSFHMYEPYSYTYFGNRGKYKYPGAIPVGEGDTPAALNWNRAELKNFLAPIVSWSNRNHIAPNRIYVGEFGVFRQAPGAAQYLKDLISIFNEMKWHWSFYSFREDTWAGMDFEMGKRALPDSYWQAEERGENSSRIQYYNKNALFEAIQQGLKTKNFK